jgi:hypothetical protein
MSIKMVGSLLVDGLSKHDDCNEDTVTAMRSKEDLAVVSPEKKRSRDEVLAIVPTEKKQRSRDVDLETKEDDSFNKALAAHPDVRSTIPERKKTNDDDLEPTVLERNKKDDDGIESFLVASFKNDDVQAMRDDRVECIYESLQGRLGFFRFRKRGLIDNEDGFSAQISYAIGNSFPPFDRFSSMVPVTACKYKNMNIAVKNLADGFPQMRYVMVEDSETTTNKCAAQMVKVSSKEERLCYYKNVLTNDNFKLQSLLIVIVIVQKWVCRKPSIERGILLEGPTQPTNPRGNLGML